jgi:hypothetical protein
MNCTIDNCGKEATHTFVWPWGTEGACCQDHVVVVQQKAKNARGRYGQVSFTRLDPDRPVEMRRDERIELHSARLTAESERDDARLRASKLHEQLVNAQNEIRSYRARVAQFEAAEKELRAQVEIAIRERDNALIAADRARELAEESAKFGMLEDPRERETPPEGQPPHVVE